MNAYGCSLGGGQYFLTQKNGTIIKCGAVIDLACEIYREKEFFKRFCKIYTNDLFGSKSFLLLSMMREVLVFLTYINYCIVYI